MHRKHQLLKLWSLAVLCLVALSAPATALAQAPAPVGGGYNLDDLNPLHITGSPYAAEFSTPLGFLSRVLVFAFPLAGLILFLMISWGGFEILFGASAKKSVDAGKQRITAAVIGFLLLFTSYWIMRVVETVFGIAIF